MKKIFLGMLAASLLVPCASFAAARKSAPRVLTGVLNLNTASASQLDAMPGVGPKAAERIIAYRAKTPFTRAEDLVKVKGFGKKKLDKLKAHLSVSGPTTLKVGEGSSDEAPAAQGRTAPKR
jgi:competence protein ComEA